MARHLHSVTFDAADLKALGNEFCIGQHEPPN